MSEQSPSQQPAQDELLAQQGQGYDPNSGFTYKQYLEQGGETGQQLRQRIESEMAGKQPAQQATETIIRPVEDGELNGTQGGKIHVSDGKEPAGVLRNDEQEDDDSLLPVGAMAHEPWTIDVVKKDEQTQEPPKDGKSSSEGKSGEHPKDIDPRSRIGKVIEERIDELKGQGSKESDAHAQSHDEFWGGATKEDDSNGPEEPGAPEPPEDPIEDPEDPPGPPEDDDEEPTAPTPEGPPTSPELEAAEAEVEEAREELARLRAGRESATFFSIKYSKKKVEAAFERYEQAKAKAGEIAVNLLREQGVEGKELASAINWGSMVEVTDLIDKQYEIEQNAVESKRLRGFYDWWKKQSGIKGMIKKGLVTAAVGVPVGVGAAIAAAPLLAGAGLAAGGGAAVGASLARNVSKGLVGNTIRRNAEARSVAEGKRQFRTMEMKQLIDSFEESDDAILDAHIGRISRDRTQETKGGNDKRAAKAAAVGAGGALVGYLAAEGIMNLLDGNTPGGPPPPEDVYNNEGADRMRGILTQRPGAQEDWQNFGDSLPPGAVDPAAERIDELYEDIKGSLSSGESKVLNQAIGRLSATEGYGNAWTAQHMDELVRLAQDGNSLDDIIAKV